MFAVVVMASVLSLPAGAGAAQGTPETTAGEPHEQLQTRPELPGPAVRVIAPSVLATGELAQADVVFAQRRQDGRPSRNIELDLLINGRFVDRVSADQPIPLRFDESGVYRLEVRSGGGGLRGVSNPVVVHANPRFRVDWLTLAPTSPTPGVAHWQLGNLTFLTLPDERALRAGGASWLLMSGQTDPAGLSEREARNLAKAEVLRGSPAFDTRRLRAGRRYFVEAVAGERAYFWLADRAAAAGYRFSLLAGGASQNRLTAFVGEANDGLARGTYITSGMRSVLDVTVNGGEPGTRVGEDQIREIVGEVSGTAAIESIELLRNGRIIEHQLMSAELPRTRLKISFDSPSAPYLNQRDLPRNGREWLGYIKVSGARITAVTRSSLDSARQESALAESGDKVDFITWTNGFPAPLYLELDRVDEALVVEVLLSEGYEDDDHRPAYRAPSSLPGARFMLAYDDILGAARRTIRAHGYEDSVTVQLLPAAARQDITFSYTDTSSSRAEDYYSVRVSQSDGGMMWSSPVWVGGFDPVD